MQYTLFVQHYRTLLSYISQKILVTIGRKKENDLTLVLKDDYRLYILTLDTYISLITTMKFIPYTYIVTFLHMLSAFEILLKRVR